MAMIKTLLVAALATVALAAPIKLEVVPGSYIFIYNNTTGMSSAANAIFEASKVNAWEQVKKLASPSGVQMQFQFGDFSGFVAQGLKAEDVKLLGSQLSAIGNFVPDTRIKLQLPRNGTKAEYKPLPVRSARATCAAKCCKRTVLTPFNQNLDILDATSNAIYCSPVDGTQKMPVFVLDTGVDSAHPYFKGRAVKFFDCYQASLEPWTVNTDVHGHGTHVSGTIGGELYGVTTNVVINVIKTQNDEGSGSDSSILCGMNRVQQWLNSNPTSKAIISMSLGYAGINAAMDTALNKLITTFATRLIVVVSAGNWGDDACYYTFARGANVIAVGSVSNSLEESWSFSNYGKCVDILAVGEDVFSLTPNMGLEQWTGTSMAVPAVAGTIAQYWLDNPKLTGTAIRTSIASATSPLHKKMITNLMPGTPNKLLQYPCASCV